MAGRKLSNKSARTVLRLKALNAVQTKKLIARDAEIKRLNELLRDYIRVECTYPGIGVQPADSDADDENTSDAVETSESWHPEPHASETDAVSDTDNSWDDNFGKATPKWDPNDRIHRCGQCFWEILDGRCLRCHKKYDVKDKHSQENGDYFNSVSTDDRVMISARQLSPRGMTPTRDIWPSWLLPMNIARGYHGRVEEYSELLQRGATRLMCERFALEWSDLGIVAWLDDLVYEEFAGPAMNDHDRWKLYLGRCVSLEGQDEDGAIFIVDFMEETTLFQLTISGAGRRWETYLESLGVWATRPAGDESDEESDEDAEYESVPAIGTVVRNDYEIEDEGEAEADSEPEVPADVAIKSNASDASYDPDSGDEASESDSADSDFDDNDLTSGDEMHNLQYTHVPRSTY
ncbi:unnamed protein product [Somion occarium]|uniref:DUF8191 domain-containing protein n=1 Tax=Somion occarium TaxID=3059160 RepID=A0ABP1D8A8_9APHY